MLVECLFGIAGLLVVSGVSSFGALQPKLFLPEEIQTYKSSKTSCKLATSLGYLPE